MALTELEIEFITLQDERTELRKRIKEIDEELEKIRQEDFQFRLKTSEYNN
jgi:predicted  nucleic acid-binding Zn-ribbon protein